MDLVTLQTDAGVRTVALEDDRLVLRGPDGSDVLVEGVSPETVRFEQTCEWTYDEAHAKYDTGCGRSFQFETGRIEESGFVFCPYCSGLIRAQQTIETTVQSDHPTESFRSIIGWVRSIQNLSNQQLGDRMDITRQNAWGLENGDGGMTVETFARAIEAMNGTITIQVNLEGDE